MLTRDRNVDPDAAIARRVRTLGMNPAINLTNGIVMLINSRSFASKLLAARIFARTVTGSVSFNLAISPADGLLFPAILAIDAVPEKFKLITNTVIYLSSGVGKSKAPATAIAFSSAYTVNNAQGAGTAHFGAFLVQVDAAGTVSTKAVSADQDYATSALAVASLPAADATKVALGYIVVQSKAATKWTATIDDMTNASDCTTATFTAYAARTPLTAALVPVAASSVDATMDTSAITEQQAELDEYIAVLCTTDGTGALVDGRMELDFRAGRVFRGE